MDRNSNYFQNAPDEGIDYFKGNPNASVGNVAAPVVQQGAPPVETQPNVDQTGGDDTPTLEAFEQLRTEHERIKEADRAKAARLQQLEADRMQRNNEQARLAWDNLEAQAKAAAADMEYEQSHEYLASFYKTREAAILNNSNQMLTKFAANVYVNDVVQRYGLKPDDAVLLGSDPNRYDEIAARIKSERDESEARYKELEEQIRQQGTSRYVQNRVASGAYVNGGGGGRDLPVDTSRLSERDHLRYLLEGTLPQR
jgi:hypothetical protein